MACKLVVVGQASVGKSALSLRFVRDEFVSVYEPTVEDSYRKPVEIDGQVHIAEIIDTAGSDQFSAMRELYFTNSDGFLLVCSVDSEGSVEELSTIRTSIMRSRFEDHHIPMVICLNKTDLSEGQWVNQKSEISSFAKALNIPFFCTSAKEGKNVSKAFCELIKLVLKSRGEPKAKSKSARKNSCALL